MKWWSVVYCIRDYSCCVWVSYRFGRKKNELQDTWMFRLFNTKLNLNVHLFRGTIPMMIWEFCSVFCSWTLCANCAFVLLQFILFYFGSAPNAMLFILSPCLSFSRKYGDSFNTICTHTYKHSRTHIHTFIHTLTCMHHVRSAHVRNVFKIVWQSNEQNDCTNQLHVNPDQSFDKLSMHRETKR